MLAVVLPATAARSADRYTTNAELPGLLRSLASRSNGLLEVETLATDAQGRAIPLVRAGAGRPEDPAVLVVAGLDGRHLVGTELALATLRKLAEHPDSGRVHLAEATLYVVPRLCLDGARAFAATPSRAQAGLDGEADVDRDGLTGEDRADDLDGDGKIALVRVRDPRGEWIELPGHEGLLRKADRAKGERGEWRILVEGRDDDGDLRWNEEEDSGVRVSRNFPARFPWFERGSARHQVSEPATRALADFLVAHPNIGIVLVYGFEDNLLTLPSDRTSDPDPKSSRWNRQPLQHPHKMDLPFVKEIARRYREGVGLAGNTKRLGFGAFGVEMVPEELGGVPSPEDAAMGGLAEFVYFARGRLALATPGWSPALQMALENAAPSEPGAAAAEPDSVGAEPDSAAAEPDSTSAGPDAADAAQDSARTRVRAQAESKNEPGLKQEAEFRDWLAAHDPSGWLGWRSIPHPDFPGLEAYAGGYAPLARINPPPQLIDSIAPAHVELVESLLSDLPRVRIRDARLQSVGSGLHELRFTVENTGYLPDRLALGEYSAEVRPTRYELRLPGGAEVLGAAPRGALERLEGSGGWREVRLLVRMPSGGNVTIEAISELGGRDSRTLRPGEHWRAPEEGGAR